MAARKRHPFVTWFPKHVDVSVASTRLRALAPIEALGRRGWHTGLHDPAAPERPDIVVFGKRYGTADIEHATRLRAQGVRVAFDICDNMFFNPEGLESVARERRKLLRMIALADRVVCSTPTLADILVREAGLGQQPTVVDDPYEAPTLPDRRAPANDPPRLLWFGRDGALNAPNGIADLAVIAEPLVRWHRERPFELVVCSNRRDTYERVVTSLGLSSRFVEWTLDGFGTVLAGATAVLLPYRLNDFVIAKTHNRLTLALGAGVPALATAIPSYREFEAYCHLDDWEAGLATVLERPADAHAKAAPARAWVEQQLSVDVIAEQWMSALMF